MHAADAAVGGEEARDKAGAEEAAVAGVLRDVGWAIGVASCTRALVGLVLLPILAPPQALWFALSWGGRGVEERGAEERGVEGRGVEERGVDDRMRGGEEKRRRRGGMREPLLVREGGVSEGGEDWEDDRGSERRLGVHEREGGGETGRDRESGGEGVEGSGGRERGEGAGEEETGEAGPLECWSS